MVYLRVERISHLFHRAHTDHALKVHPEKFDAERLVELVHLFEDPAVGVVYFRDLSVAACVAVDIDEVHSAVKLAGEGDRRHFDGAADEFLIHKRIVAQLVCGEYFDLELCSLNSTEELKTALQSAMVEGIDILDVRLLDDAEGNAMASVEAASYYVTIRDSVVLPDGFMKKLLAFYEQDNIPVVKETKRGHKEINLKESIYELSVVSCALGKADEEAKERIYMKLNASSGGNIKPGFVLESFCNSISYELPPFGYTVHRIETYREREGEFVPLLWEKS